MRLTHVAIEAFLRLALALLFLALQLRLALEQLLPLHARIVVVAARGIWILAALISGHAPLGVALVALLLLDDAPRLLASLSGLL